MEYFDSNVVLVYRHPSGVMELTKRTESSSELNYQLYFNIKANPIVLSQSASIEMPLLKTMAKQDGETPTVTS